MVFWQILRLSIHLKWDQFSSECTRLNFAPSPQKKNTSHLTHTHPPHSHPTPPSLLQEVVARVLNDGTDIVLQRGPASCRWQASIYRLQGTESRKGNISLSLDTQNATAVGGHRLQTEISSYISGRWWEGAGGRRGTGDKGEDREAGRQRRLDLAQSNMEKGCRQKRSNSAGCW